MAVYLFFIVLIINIVLSLTQQKSKLVFFISIFALGLIYASNARTGVSDLAEYRRAYILQSTGMVSANWRMEAGYALVADYCSKIGMPFALFLAIIFITCSLMIWRFLKRYTVNLHVFITLYCLFFFFFTLEGLRFYIATSLIIFGISFLMEKRKVLFIVISIIAMSFHVFSAFFLLFVFVEKKISTKTYRSIFIVCGLLCVIIFLNGNQIPGIEYIYGLLFKDWKTGYISSHTRFGFAFFFMYHFLSIGLILISRNMINRMRRACNIDNEDRINELYDFVYKANLLTTVTFPLIMLNTAFFRFTFVTAIMSFILVSAVLGNYIPSNKKNNPNNIGLAVYSKDLVNYYVGIILIMTIWSSIWWYLKENAIGMIDALEYCTLFLD